MEQFVCRVFQGGKVTIPKRLRELLGVEDGNYVRLALVEVVKLKVKVKRDAVRMSQRGV
jgi:bifunctional DNA-binding transcriptional regulator/antitoxin component of YhaV-PrlF toxin-antitoxin module